MKTRRKKIVARGDRLSDLPDSILIHILSMLWVGKEVVRTSVLSRRWQFLWMSVPVSLEIKFPEDHYFPLSGERKNNILDFVISTHRDLHYWRSCHKIREFNIDFEINEERFVKDVDLWVYFATKFGNVEDFTLDLMDGNVYKFPQFAYKNTSLRNLVLYQCELNPCTNVNWCALVSLSFRFMRLDDGVMEKLLSGCPNLECLEFYYFGGFHRLKISNVKLTKLIMENLGTDECDVWLEISAPYIQNLQLLGSCHGICLRNVASLVTAVLCLEFDFNFEDQDPLQRKESSCFKELLHSGAHVENLELGPWCIKCLSILELEGWQPPPSSWKFLQLNTTLEQLDFPAICRFLQSSSDLETLVIDGYNSQSRNLLPKYTNEDEQSRRFETHIFNYSLLHLKTIKINTFYEPLSKNKSVLSLVKYLLKHATVLEKFVIAVRFYGTDVWSDASQDCVKLKQEVLSSPRSSPHASVIFSY